MVNFLKWWLIFCLESLILGTAAYSGFLMVMILGDPSFVSVFIMVVWLFSSIFIGYQTYQVMKSEPGGPTDTSTGWFLSELCMGLGLVGTVIGFILMLGAFYNFSFVGPEQIKGLILEMAIGSGTALYATLTGIVSSIFVKVQMLNLDKAINEKSKQV